MYKYLSVAEITVVRWYVFNTRTNNFSVSCNFKMAKITLILTTVVIVLVLCTHTIQGDDETVEIQTKYGVVRGRVRTADNGAKVNEFLGIPYAAPPVGNLRFKKPQQPENFTDGIFEADKMPPACMQHAEPPYPAWYDSEADQSEDCLYLNIWAPANKGKQLRGTKFYVHGGGWFEGGSIRMGYYDGFGEAVDTMDGNGKSKQDGIVVVTVNYRLGALGFLTSGTPDAPGNVGLFDLRMAHMWMADNLKFFGGLGQVLDQKPKIKDESKIPITLEGQGSGAIAVSLLRMTNEGIPETYHFKTVLHGASFLTLKALPGVDEVGDSYFNNLRLADLLAQAVGCEASIKDSPNDTIACLRGIEAPRLVRVAASLSGVRGPPNVFLPQTNRRYDQSRLFNFNPYFSLHNLALADMFDTYVSFTSSEGSSLLTAAVPKVFGSFGENDVPLSAACAKKVTRKLLKNFPQCVADSLLGDLDRNATIANRNKVVQAVGDAYFHCPIVYWAEEMKRVKGIDGSYPKSKPYLVEKQVSPPYNPWAEWMGSVPFSEVQIDFLHPDKQLNLNNQTYDYTDQQMEQARVGTGLLKSFLNGNLQLKPFALADRMYNVLESDGKLSEQRRHNFHDFNCDILRPYFVEKGDSLNNNN